MLEREFYLQDAVNLAKSLIGKKIVHNINNITLSGMIVETEAYMGTIDDAAHSYKASPDGRTNIQYKDGGYSYVYMIYGIHFCFNVTANVMEIPEAVLIRALMPLEGIEYMKKQRNTENIYNLSNGPGKLCKALCINKTHYGIDLCTNESLYIDQYMDLNDDILTSKRINVDYAKEGKDYPWRFYIKGNKYVSKVPSKYLNL